MASQRALRRDARKLVESVEQLPAADWYGDEDPNENGDIIERVFLGTVFNLTPSGKYYMPFACSNVEPCARCKGTGCDYCGELGSREAFEDEFWSNAVGIYAHKERFWVVSGEGDPCDIFAERIANIKTEVA